MRTFAIFADAKLVFYNKLLMLLEIFPEKWLKQVHFGKIKNKFFFQYLKIYLKKTFDSQGHKVLAEEIKAVIIAKCTAQKPHLESDEFEPFLVSLPDKFEFIIEALQSKSTAAKDEEFVNNFSKALKKQSIHFKFIEDSNEMFATNGIEGGFEKISEMLWCIYDAINNAVNESEFEELWKTTKKELETLHKKLNACKNESSLAEVAA